MTEENRYMMMYGIELDYEDIDKIEEMSDEEEFDDILDNWIISSADVPTPTFYFGIVIYITEKNNTTVYNRPTAKTLWKTKEYINSFDLNKEIGYHYLSQFSISDPI